MMGAKDGGDGSDAQAMEGQDNAGAGADNMERYSGPWAGFGPLSGAIDVDRKEINNDNISAYLVWEPETAYFEKTTVDPRISTNERPHKKYVCLRWNPTLVAGIIKFQEQEKLAANGPNASMHDSLDLPNVLEHNSSSIRKRTKTEQIEHSANSKLREFFLSMIAALNFSQDISDSPETVRLNLPDVFKPIHGDLSNPYDYYQSRVAQSHASDVDQKASPRFKFLVDAFPFAALQNILPNPEWVTPVGISMISTLPPSRILMPNGRVEALRAELENVVFTTAGLVSRTPLMDGTPLVPLLANQGAMTLYNVKKYWFRNIRGNQTVANQAPSNASAGPPSMGGGPAFSVRI
jgi:hypothetical protein